MFLISDTQLRSMGLSPRATTLWGPLIRSFLAILLVSVAVFQFVVYSELAATTISVRDMSDFGVFYESSRRVLRHMDPYVGGDAMRNQSPNLNPPHFILLTAPMALLQKPVAFALWTALSVASALFALIVMFREMDWRVNATTVTWTLVSILCGAATGALLHTAQIGWLLWGPAISIWARARRRQWTSAAVMLGVVMSVKPFMGLLLFPIVRKGGWRFGIISAGVASLCYGAGAAILGFSALFAWVRAIRSVTWAGFIFNSSLFGYVTRLLDDKSGPIWHLQPFRLAPEWVGWFWLLGSAGILLLTISRLPSRHREIGSEEFRLDVDREFAAVSSAALLITPLGWIYYHFFLAGPIVALVSDRDWRRAIGWRVWLLGAAFICLTRSPGELIGGQPSPWATATLGSAYFWALLAVWFTVLA